MPTSIISVYDSAAVAHEVIEDLLAAGCSEEDVDIVASEEEDTTGDAVLDELVDLGLAVEDAELYAEAARHGKAVVAARASEGRAADVEAIMERHGALTYEELRAIEDEAEEGDYDINGGEGEEAEDEDEDDDLDIEVDEEDEEEEEE